MFGEAKNARMPSFYEEYLERDIIYFKKLHDICP
jgi:hypothetical protein